MEHEVEAMLASPPDRDELVVQLFISNGPQFAEVFRSSGDVWVDLYVGSEVFRIRASKLNNAIQKARDELIDRLSQPHDD